MDIRRAVTKYGKRLHRTAWDDNGRGDGALTFCNFHTSEFESENPGRIQEWDDRERKMGACVRCDKAVQKLAEE